jgi:hypothetical protein
LEEFYTIFDSLETGLPKHGLAREMVECIFIGSAMGVGFCVELIEECRTLYYSPSTLKGRD